MELISKITESPYFLWVILPILIFCSRILDVTFGTLRIIFVSRGKKFIAPLLGFCEVLIWLIVITNLMANLNNWICYIAYAAGFAAGNFVGIHLEEKLAIGMLSVRIFVSDDKVAALSKKLSEKGFGVTRVKGTGSLSDTNILTCIIRRKEYAEIVAAIHEVDPSLFYFAEELKHVCGGIFLNNDYAKKK
jgi:uncharacterized protein YebE (UPF0316 family)